MSNETVVGSSARPRRAEIAILIALTIAAAALRFYQLGCCRWARRGRGRHELARDRGRARARLSAAAQRAHYWKGLPYTLSAALVSLIFGLRRGRCACLPRSRDRSRADRVVRHAGRLRRLGRRGARRRREPVRRLSARLLGVVRHHEPVGRFYELGLTLFLAGAAVAVNGFSAAKPAKGSVWVFSALALIASATFHSGAILWIAPFAALLLGTRFTPRETKILAGFLLATLAWFAGVLFFWKSGHVEAGSGWQDLRIMTKLPFWKHMIALSVVGFGGWALIVRRGARASKAAAGAIVLLVLIEAAIFVAAGINGVDTGALRGFQLLATSHPGLMVSRPWERSRCCCSRFPCPGRPPRGGARMDLTMVPIALVGASTGNFVPATCCSRSDRWRSCPRWAWG
jgi:hypothetical protein